MNVPRLLRTVGHLRPRQIGATLVHALRPTVRPRVWTGEPPRPRVVASPVPFLGAPRHARATEDAAFRFLNREVAFEGGRPDWDFAGEGPLWSFHLHQFDWARAPDLSAARRGAWLLDWVARHRDGIGWRPGPISLRSINWMKLLLTPGALALDPTDDARLRASLAGQLATLDGHLEVRLLANHYFSNLIALVMAGALLEAPGCERWRCRQDELRRELAEQVHGDGSHCERSPMYHALMFEHVLDLLNVLHSTGGAPELERELADVAGRMAGALEVMVHPDGEIALFADSAFGIAAHPAELARYAAELGVEVRSPARAGVLDEGGYVRLEAAPFSLLASVAGPAPAYQPGHAHCDALAFELCIGRTRVVTDAGVCEYVPGERRHASRATRSHATAEVGGREQAEIWAAHRVGGRPDVRLVAAEPRARAHATCAGWATRDTVHRRLFEVAPAAVTITDSFAGAQRSVCLTLPLATGLEPRLVGRRATLALPDTGTLVLDLPEGVRWRVEERPCFPEFGREEARAALVGETTNGGPHLWRFTLR